MTPSHEQTLIRCDDPVSVFAPAPDACEVTHVHGLPLPRPLTESEDRRLRAWLRDYMRWVHLRPCDLVERIADQSSRSTIYAALSGRPSGRRFTWDTAKAVLEFVAARMEAAYRADPAGPLYKPGVRISLWEQAMRAVLIDTSAYEGTSGRWYPRERTVADVVLKLDEYESRSPLSVTYSTNLDPSFLPTECVGAWRRALAGRRRDGTPSRVPRVASEYARERGAAMLRLAGHIRRDYYISRANLVRFLRGESAVADPNAIPEALGHLIETWVAPGVLRLVVLDDRLGGLRWRRHPIDFTHPQLCRERFWSYVGTEDLSELLVEFGWPSPEVSWSDRRNWAAGGGRRGPFMIRMLRRAHALAAHPLDPSSTAAYLKRLYAEVSDGGMAEPSADHAAVPATDPPPATTLTPREKARQRLAAWRQEKGV